MYITTPARRPYWTNKIWFLDQQAEVYLLCLGDVKNITKWKKMFFIQLNPKDHQIKLILLSEQTTLNVKLLFMQHQFFL